VPDTSGTPEETQGILGSDHVGNPFAEQKAFFSGRAVVALPGYEVISVSGPDRLTWLDALSSQALRGLTPGVTTESLLLTPQGRVEYRWLMVDDGATSWLLVEPSFADGLMAWFERMVFRSEVTLARHADAFHIFALWSDAALAGGDIQPLVSWVDPWPGVAEGGFAYSAPEHPGSGFSLQFVAVADPEVFSEVSRAGGWALEAAEIRAGRPSLRAEVDDKTLPHEVDWLRTAVHLNKGCYRGQETVAKVHNLGHPPRRLVLLHLDGSESVLPRSGSEVSYGDKVVGHVTRAVNHHEWGPIALAMVKRAVPGDGALMVSQDGMSIAANQDVLVAPDAGRVNAPNFSRK
jgi:folate-binding protein YgfZ